MLYMLQENYFFSPKNNPGLERDLAGYSTGPLSWHLYIEGVNPTLKNPTFLFFSLSLFHLLILNNNNNDQ